MLCVSCECIHMSECRCLLTPEEAIRSLEEAEITGICELQDVGAGKQVMSSW